MSRIGWLGAPLVACALLACGAPRAAQPDATGPGTADGGGDAAADAPGPGTVPQLGTSTELCKLLSNRFAGDPTTNDVQHRSNMLGADLGIPVDDQGQLYVFFGDTIGFEGIWGDGQSHPDAIGYATAPTSSVIGEPSLLCSGLGIVSLAPGASIGPTVDPSIHADFAGGAMTAPAGHTLGEYIHNPAGPPDQPFANLPGDFEVPSGAFAYGRAIYLFYTTVGSPSDVTMKGSYLARWAAPSTSALPTYDIQYAVDERFDDAGPLRGNFINIAAEVQGDYVYLFGTGAYRASGVYLARKPLASLATPGGFEVFDPASAGWVPGGTDVAPVIGPAGFGETSVRYFPSIGRWMFLAEELLPASNRIVARFAEHPEGPWSDEIVVHDMADPAFTGSYCCAADDQCDGAEFLDCDRTGFYGSYLLPDVLVHGDGSFSVHYTLSTFAPYNVALFSTTFTP